jgi:hypothetical protein
MYGQRLVLTPSTEWVNVPDDVRRDLLMRNLQLEVKLRYVSQRTGPRTNWKPLYVCLCGVAISFAGAGLAFSVNYGPGNPWAYVAFGMGVFGWVVGVVGIASGWFSMLQRYPP